MAGISLETQSRARRARMFWAIVLPAALASCSLAADFDGLTGANGTTGPADADTDAAVTSPTDAQSHPDVVVNILPPDLLATGDGKDGALTVVSGQSLVVNACVPVQSVMQTALQVGAFPVQPPGRVLLVLQMQDALQNPGVSVPIGSVADLGDAGKWQLVRLQSMQGGAGGAQLVVDRPIEPGIQPVGEGRSVQVCTVPEYTGVDVQAGGTLAAEEYTGNSGGVLMFFANGKVVVNGTLTASGVGFDGADPRTENSGTTSVTDDEVDCSTGRAGERGESIDGRSEGSCGRGNYANGGGSGNAHNAGGAGGGLGGSGGAGGQEDSALGGNPNTGGKPGVGLPAVLAANRLTFGGGGGAGQQNNGVAGGGGDGGGLIVVSAARIEGVGVIVANGSNGDDSGKNGNFPDGAGGGGAGGMVIISATQSTFSGIVSANGGNGGSLSYIEDIKMGPGGGGGGGIVRLLGVQPSQSEVNGGASGLFTGGTIVVPHGATAGAQGIVASQ